MDPENKEGSDDFGKVIDVLHNKAKLSSLRTYQGDVAEFMKEKNESVISVAVKEKEREEKREEEQEKIEPHPKSTQNNFQINFTMLFLSIFLIVGGITASFYIFEFVSKKSVNQIPINIEIIPYNNVITLANITNKNLGPEILKLSPENGISLVKISDQNGHLLTKTQDFYNFLEISPPPTLERTLKNEYAVGIISQNNEKFYFMVIPVNDFGRAFSAMLDWEENMVKDLSFLNTEISTSTEDFFSWKDLIIKNKDTRALVNSKNKTRLAYTFLDKNTVLIVNNLSAIGEISSIYASRSVVR